MKKATLELIEELKQNGEDREWYPTSKEMIRSIYNHRFSDDVCRIYGYYSSRNNGFGKVLDIGCGTENFRKYINEIHDEEASKIADESGWYDRDKVIKIGNEDYFVIEKSQILIEKLSKNTVVVGTDFYNTELMMLEMDTIFCNPPYSDFEQWIKRILLEANFKEAYFVIPQRWKENKEIINIIEQTLKAEYKVIGNFDFLHAERQARAVVDIVYIDARSRKHETPFDRFFNEFYWNEEKLKEERKQKGQEQEEKIRNAVMVDKGVANNLVDCYNDEFLTLSEHFQCISQLEPDVLQAIGVDTAKVKTALKEKMNGLKNKYWKLLFDNMEEITSKLTSQTRGDLYDRFTRNINISFTLENIYPTLLWVIKNANEYYNTQIVDFFEKLSDMENVKPYKSNQRLCHENWRYGDVKKYARYTLDYRIICSRLSFSSRYSWSNEIDAWTCRKVVDDICVIMQNMQFQIGYKDYAEVFGKKYYIYDTENKPLMEYKVYGNGNVHIKFNKDVMKCLNITVARLLGWINTKEEARQEMPEDYSKDIDKYWDRLPYISLTGASGMKLLGTTKA